MVLKTMVDDLECLPNELIFAIQNLYIPAGLNVTTLGLRESESSEYGACRFGLNGKTVAFRIAKTTPRKIGQFVTIWKRQTLRDPIAPLDATDNVEFLVVSVSSGIRSGQFVFDKEILITKNIMSQGAKGGKRAFRLYPPWTKPLSKEALKTQKWQLSYFFSFVKDGIVNLEEVSKLFKYI